MRNNSEPSKKPAVVFSLITHGLLFCGLFYITTIEKKPANLNGQLDGKALTVAELLKGDGGDPTKPDRLITSAAPTASKDEEKKDEGGATEALPPAVTPAATEAPPAPAPEPEKPAAPAAATPEPPKPEKAVEKKADPKPEADEKALLINRQKKEEEKKKEQEKKKKEEEKKTKELAEKKEKEAADKKAREEAEKKAKVDAEKKAEEQKRKELAEAELKKKHAALTPEQASKLRPAPSNPANIKAARSGNGSSPHASSDMMSALKKMHADAKAGGRHIPGVPAGDGRPGGGGPATGKGIGGNPLGQASEGATTLKGLGLSDNYAKEALARVARYFMVPPDKEKDIATIVSVTISRSGKLSNMKISKSSGSPDLDEIAMNALESTKNFPPFPDDFEKDSADVEISFSFQD
ncbi:cell envelope integrity protein TolA [Candidatus Sumerlaeota bacterium]|nr:cell envelope integrity protein TolA [Candidatus Sumerlaeota bacterium]